MADIIGDPVGRTIVAVSSPSELAESIPFTSLALPEYTMALAYEADHVFTNLLYVSEREAQVPVVVKLGQDALQVASVSRPLWPNSHTVAETRSHADTESVYNRCRTP